MSRLAYKYGLETLKAARKYVAEQCAGLAERERERLATHPHATPEVDHDNGSCSCVDHVLTTSTGCLGLHIGRAPANSLEEFAREMWGGNTIHWLPDWTGDSYALSWYLRDQYPLDDMSEYAAENLARAIERGERFDDRDAEWLPAEPHHWTVLEDMSPRFGHVPVKVADRADQRAFAEQWRASHRSLREREVAVLALPGHQVIFALWSPTKLTEADGRALAWELSGDAAEPRFRAVAYPLTPPDLPDNWTDYAEGESAIYLPAVAAPVVALPKASDLARAPEQASTKILTGINAIDTLSLGAPGIARNSTWVLYGREGSCKSTLAYVVAEAANGVGYTIGWLAHDQESPEQVTARRLQRRGLSFAEAEALPPSELAKLDGDGFEVLGKEWLLEQAWQGLYEEATRRGQPLLMVVDSLHQVLTDGAASGQRERLDETLRLVNQCRAKWPATVIVTCEQTDDGKPKGSTSIRHFANVMLHTTRRGDDLRIEVAKYTGGREPTFTLKLDALGQRVLDPEAAARAKASAELRAAIVGAVRDLGAKATGQRIEGAITGHDNKVVRAELAAMVASGALLHPAPRQPYQLP
jgi:hypothetical protein